MKKPQSSTTSTRFTFIFRHAWCEFRRCFKGLLNGSSAPGGRDFLLLTLAASLLLGVGLILAIIYYGLMSRFADSLLGHIEGYGIPVWVSASSRIQVFKPGLYRYFNNQPHSEDLEEFELSSSSIDILKKADLFPFIEISKADTIVQLPDRDNIWTRESNEPEFSGWAVTSDDPLWLWSLKENGIIPEEDRRQKAPLQIILNASVFHQFNYSAYLNYLEDKIPQTMFNKLPQSLDRHKPRELEELWLKIGKSGELTPFEIIWVESFPALTEVVFLLPLNTIRLARLLDHPPQDLELKYYMESIDGSEVIRIKDILLKRPKNGPAQELMKETRECLPKNVWDEKYMRHEEKVILNWTISFEPPLPESWISACLNEQDSSANKIKKTETKSDEIQIYQDRIKICSEPGKCKNYEFNIPSGGEAIVYVHDRNRLMDIKEELTKLRLKNNENEQIFYMGWKYEGAVNRFGFLTITLEWLFKPVFLGWALFAFYLIWFSLMSILDHRRNSYGILMANGVKPAWFRWILFFQICMALLIGFILACIAVEMAVWATNTGFLNNDAASIVRHTLGLGQMQLLPHLWHIPRPVIWIFTSTFLISVFAYCVVFWRFFFYKSLPTDLLE